MSESWALPVIENALLLLVDYPDPEGVAGPIADTVGGDAAARLTLALEEDLLRAALELDDCTTYVFFDPAEREDDVLEWLEPFGVRVVLAAQLPGGCAARMRAAFRRIFARNATGRALLVRAGHPQIGAALLRTALDALAGADVVVAPSSSGGVCLLGMSRMHDALFADLERDGGCAADAVLRACVALGLRAVTLPEQREAATPAHLDELLPGWRSRV